MKTKVKIIVLLMLMPLSLLAQPKLTITNKIIDCGEVLFGKPVTARFELKNRGFRQLNIDTVETSCGCTVADYPQKSVSAGQRFSISATFDARMLGHFNKQVAVHFRGFDKPVYLTFTGIVASGVIDYSGTYPFKIGSLHVDKNDIEFDNVNCGDTPIAEMLIVNGGKQVYKPVIMHLPAYLTVTAVPAELYPKQSGKIFFALDSKKLRDYGLTQTMVHLSRFPGDNVCDENSINVSAVMLPDFKDMTESQLKLAPSMHISQKSVELGSFGGKPKKKGTVIITNSGSSNLNITSLQVFTSGLEVTLGKRVLKSGETTKMKVTAVAKYLKMARSKPRVLMITNDPSMSKVIIDINVK
jgi:hypothetical protein